MKPKKPIKINNINTVLAKFSEIQKEIKLTDLECYFIIFSSIDHDFFNHLIIS